MASGWRQRNVDTSQWRLSFDDDDQDNYYSADMDFLSHVSTPSLLSYNEHDEQPNGIVTGLQSPEIYELFVGNLAMDVSEGNLELALNEILGRNSVAKIEQLIRPRRGGRPFAFVRPYIKSI